ncbi:MAG TPA: hypothetical protein VD931_06575 [Baekduia sp.]|nr:hypothetical protein [Baekduia sp.]
MAGDADPEVPERLWLRRLRWRLRGAWQWPTFALVTVGDAIVLSRLPFAGEGGGFVPAFLAAGFANLVVVAALAPAVAALVRRRRPALPVFLARDRAGTALLVALLAVLVAGGLAHRPAVQEADRDFEAQADAVRRHLATAAPPQARAGAGAADTVKQGDDLFRTCVPTADPDRAYCLIVDTDRSPPQVIRDPDQRPNAVVSGPLSPGSRP